MAAIFSHTDTAVFSQAARRLADDIANETRLAEGDPSLLIDIATSAIYAERTIHRAVQQSITEFRHARRQATGP